MQTYCSDAFFHDELNKDAILLVFYQKKIIGYAKWGRMTLPVENPIEPCAEIDRLYIDSAFQGQGIGQILMQNMMDDLSHKAAIYLSVIARM